MKITLNLNKGVFILLVLILFFGIATIFLSIVSIAQTSGVSHDWNEVSNRPAGLDDGDQIGITSETDPTVVASVKDGVSWNEVSSKPSICLSDGTNCPSTQSVPSGMIAIFDTSCPSGWTRVSTLDSRFPRGSSSYGGTGGTTSHVHTVGISALPWGGALPTDIFAYADTYTTSSSQNLPPYLDVVFCKKN